MPSCRFRSFQDTPILYFTLRVVYGLPLLADEVVPGILRQAWLNSAMADRWFVGAYCILPNRVSLFASPARTASIDYAWLATWQESTTRRINEATGGVGRIWADFPPPLPVGSMHDYQGLRTAMGEEAPVVSVTAGALLGKRDGMVWQLLSTGEPIAAPAPLGIA